MTTPQKVAVWATLPITELTVNVAALWNEEGDTLASSLVCSRVALRNISQQAAVQCQVDAGAWTELPRRGTHEIAINLSTSTLKLRKVQFPTTEEAVEVLVHVYATPSALLAGADGGDDVDGTTWTLPPAGTALLSSELAWEDLRFPAQGINPLGAATPPAVDESLTSFTGTLLFAGNLENVIAGVAQMPHSWARGTAIRPHIHWSKPVGSASAVDWVFYYRHLGFPSDVADAWVGPVAGTLALGAPGTADAHCITTFGEIAMTDKRESSMICWQLRRLGNTDADNGTARLYELDFRYQTDKRGTVPEIPAA